SGGWGRAVEARGASPALPELRVGWIVTSQTRAGVLAQRLGAAAPEVAGVGVHALAPTAHAVGTPAADVGRRVTQQAVALLVTADAGVQVALRLPWVVVG